jgi:Zn finger protein HypA/HybF involved in hydrogenase expression
MHSSFPTRVFAAAAGLAAALAFAPALTAQQPKAPDSVVLTGSPLGGVKFAHKVHAQDRKIDCKTCHHASRPEKPLKSEYQKCTDCHTKSAAAPMKTPTRGAFHDAMAKKGTCVDCHVAGNAKGKKAPLKCPDCHKKENG